MARQLDPTKRKLTDIQCKSAKPLRDENGSTKPIKLSDGYGLNLEVRSDGKFWFYAFRLNGKQLKLNLGGYPTVRLSDAREMHQTAWIIVQDGEDPPGRQRLPVLRKNELRLSRESWRRGNLLKRQKSLAIRSSP